MLKETIICDRSDKAKRKARRKDKLDCYKRLKKRVNNDAKKGKTTVSLHGKNEVLGIAARLLYKKSEGLRIIITMRENENNFYWRTNDVTIKWAKGVIPALIMRYIQNDDE